MAGQKSGREGADELLGEGGANIPDGDFCLDPEIINDSLRKDEVKQAGKSPQGVTLL